MDLKFKEAIGNFEIIHSSQVLLFKNRPVTISIIENDEPVYMRFEFTETNEGKPEVASSIEDGVLVWRFTNKKDSNAVFYLEEPMAVAKGTLDGSDLYFNCFISTINYDEGIRVFAYSFYKLKQK